MKVKVQCRLETSGTHTSFDAHLKTRYYLAYITVSCDLTSEKKLRALTMEFSAVYCMSDLLKILILHGSLSLIINSVLRATKSKIFHKSPQIKQGFLGIPPKFMVMLLIYMHFINIVKNPF